MTRKDFKAIAAAVDQAMDTYKTDLLVHNAIADVRDAMICYFKQAYPHFNEEKFRDACMATFLADVTVRNPRRGQKGKHDR